jgi:cold shock CspA family protein/ribosome-associated translation inhibitor RaiA
MMKANEVMTKFPLQVTFRNVEPLPAMELKIRSEAAKLETFYERIMGCRVSIESPHRHHREGSPYHVRIDLTVPGGELVVKHEPSLRTRARRLGETAMKKHSEARDPHKNLRQAISNAFKAAARRLQDYARRQRGDIKHRESRPVARVSRLFADEGYGFLTTADAREVYFHKDSVLNRAFGRLKVGSIVSFAEEQGEKGPQASTVRIVGRHRTGQAAWQPAA